MTSNDGATGSPAEHREPCGSAQLTANGARLYQLTVRPDARGKLSYAEVGNPLPFVPVRYFTVSEVPAGAVRGSHAHRECHQFLVVVAGSCIVEITDGARPQILRLTGVNAALHAPPMTWITLHDFSDDAVLLVLASHLYDEADYIRDFDRFLSAARNRHA